MPQTGFDDTAGTIVVYLYSKHAIKVEIMRAMVLKNPGEALSLCEIATPTPQSKQLLIKVDATILLAPMGDFISLKLK